MSTEPTDYVLIDFENIQPETFTGLKLNFYKVIVFVGARQTKVPVELAILLHSLGPRAEYFRVADAGPNALDFHIAYKIGRLVTEEPNCSFHIVSADRGFDPLIAHLNASGITARRVADPSEKSIETSIVLPESIPVLKSVAKSVAKKASANTTRPATPAAVKKASKKATSTAKTTTPGVKTEHFEIALSWIRAVRSPKPQTVKTLRLRLFTALGNKVPREKLPVIVNWLADQGVFKIVGEKRIEYPSGLG